MGAREHRGVRRRPRRRDDLRRVGRRRQRRHAARHARGARASSARRSRRAARRRGGRHANAPPSHRRHHARRARRQGRRHRRAPRASRWTRLIGATGGAAARSAPHGRSAVPAGRRRHRRSRSRRSTRSKRGAPPGCTLLTGTNRHEITLFNLMPGARRARRRRPSPSASARGTTPTRVAVVADYRSRRPDAVGLELWTDIGTDAVFRSRPSASPRPSAATRRSGCTSSLGRHRCSAACSSRPMRSRSRSCSTTLDAPGAELSRATAPTVSPSRTRCTGAWIAFAPHRRPEPPRNPRLARSTSPAAGPRCASTPRSRSSTTRGRGSGRLGRVPEVTGPTARGRRTPVARSTTPPGRGDARPSRGRRCACPTPTSTTPRPEWRRPAHGSRTHERSAVFQYALPTSSRPRMRSARARSRGEHRGAEPELGVVHAGDRLVVAVDPRAHRSPARSSPRASSAMRSSTSTTTVGSNQLPGRSMRAPPVDDLRAPLPPRRRVARRARRAARPRQRPDVGRRRRWVADPVRAATTSTNASTKPSQIASCTYTRSVALHDWPAVVERTLGDGERGALDIHVVAHVRRRPCRPARAARGRSRSAAAAQRPAGRLRTSR